MDLTPSQSAAPGRHSALDIPISITYFRDFAAQSKTEATTSLRAIVPKLRDARAPAKSTLPWLKLATFGDLRTDKNSLRSDRNVLAIHGVEGDYDAKQITMERARQIIQNAGIAAILYTSPSHAPNAPKWRVLCPTSEPLPPGDRARLLSRVNGLFVGALARESFTLSQAYYYGAITGAEHHEVVAIDGRAIDLAHELDAGAVGAPERPRAPTLPYTPPQRRAITNSDGTAYGLAGLDRECTAIMNAADGEKHHTLNKAAYSIGGLVAAGEIHEGPAIYALSSALAGIRDRCEDFAAAEKTLRTAFDAGKAAPRQAPARPPLLRRTVEEYAPQWPEPPPYDAPPEHWQGEPEHDMPEASAPDPQAKPDALRAPRLLPVVMFADAAAKLDANDFVEGVLSRQAMSVIYGESNSGKTFFALDLGLHVASGRRWRDREVEQGLVLYLALEGSAAIMNRVAAFKAEHEMGEHHIPFAIAPVAVNLLDPDADAAAVIDTVKAVAATMEAQPMLVIVDTLARAIAGGNENASEDMGALVRNGDLIREATGAHLMWIHHSGKDQAKGARGHSSLRAATDTEIEVVAVSSSRTATVTKQRDMECSGVFAFTLKVVDLGRNTRGKAVTSCVVEVDGVDTPGGVPPRRRLTGHKQRALEVLADLIAHSGRVGDAGAPSGIASVPDKWWRERFYERAMPGAEAEAQKRAFRRAADDLVEQHVVGMGGGRVWVI